MTPKLTVFYDGACNLCSKEMAHYQSFEGAQNIIWKDFATPDFVAADYGLDPVLITKKIYAKRENQVFTGVDSFIEIWSEIPRYKMAVRLARKSLIKPILDLGYYSFVKLVRPYLLKRQCADHQCSK